MSGFELLRNSDDDIQYEGIAIYLAVVTVTSVVGGILVCCILVCVCKAVWQSQLNPPPEFMDCMICYCNTSTTSSEDTVYCMLCMPRVRRCLLYTSDAADE